MREIAAANALALRDEPISGLKERSELARTLKDLFSVWDGCRQAIRVYKGLGNPKPVEARNGASRRKRASTVAPPPASA